MPQRYESVWDFYPFYLSQHQNGACRVLHFIGTTTVLVLLLKALLQGPIWLLALLPIAGYGPAWIGHIAFEKNKPATFKYPFYSLLSDWVMWFDILRLKLPLVGQLDDSRLTRESKD